MVILIKTMALVKIQNINIMDQVDIFLVDVKYKYYINYNH